MNVQTSIGEWLVIKMLFWVVRALQAPLPVIRVSNATSVACTRKITIFIIQEFL